jgi:YidC/Oxa1 family membrane protein insertase
MDKRTILAVVLSVVIITASFVIQSVFFPTSLPQPAAAPTAPAAPAPPAAPAAPAPLPSAPQGGPIAAPAAPDAQPALAPVQEAPVRSVALSTPVFDATFSTRGAVLTSLKLKAYKEADGSPVEMVIGGESGVYPFRLYLDRYDTGNDVFVQESSLQPDRVEFSRPYVYRGSDGRDVTLNVKKSFRFNRSDYMIEFRVSLETAERDRLPIEAYSFAFGPQIGPHFAKLDERGEYRHLIYYADGKRKDFTGKVRQRQVPLEERAGWAAIEGKYFIVTGISYVADLTAYQVGFDTTPLTGLPERKQHSLTYSRLVGRNIALDEGYKFYIGPKKRDILQRYNDREKNEWRESGLKLEEAVASSFWGWLSDALKWMLEMFYRLIPNWGVAIILLTILTKILFWPLTQKSFESTSKMQALGPKLQELRAKYKDNPTKMNQETAALYKREGVNPLGGCLPLLLQMPIFFALYRLFNDYFELRGAAFIPGWIPDLSAPEQFLTLPFSIPFLGDTLNLLPFLMTGMTFLQQLVTQTPGTQPTGQTKMLLYGMPLFFFFIMYNMPSGLLLYWTVQSLLSFVQQFYINQLRAKSQAGTGDKR